MEAEDWRAVAIGYAGALAVVMFAGMSWWVPVTGFVLAGVVRAVWR